LPNLAKASGFSHHFWLKKHFFVLHAFQKKQKSAFLADSGFDNTHLSPPFYSSRQRCTGVYATVVGDG